MSYAGKLFLKSLAEQQVRLGEAEQRALEQPCETEVHNLHTLAQAHHNDIVLSGRTPAELSKPINVNQLPPEGPLRFLGALLNTSISIADTAPAVATFEAPSHRDDPACDGVEEAWRNTITAPSRGSNPLVEVFVDAEQQPVIMRKGRGAHPTGITLQPVRARAAITSQNIADHNRMYTYPPGTVVQLDTIRDDELLVPRPTDESEAYLDGGNRAAQEKLRLPNRHSLVSPLSNISGLHFARLSPYAYNNPQILNEQKYGVNDGYPPHLLNQLRAVARNVVAQYPA